jgi:serine/threonine protein phosphatase 1
MSTFVIGDIHGGDRALGQCLTRSGFDPDSDRLICLGDVCDGWPETRQVIERLLGLKNLIMILGNHDFMTLDWVRTGVRHPGWMSQGGSNTIASYDGKMPEAHVQLLESASSYLIEKNRLFVHAGILPDKPMDEQGDDIFLWDRTLFRIALDQKLSGTDRPITSFDEIYIGHSPVHNYGWLEPVRSGEVWMMDTGAGWTGKLSMMNIETKEAFISDPVHTLYPPGSGRAG